MSWFQLDPERVAQRVRAEGHPANVPSLTSSMLRGAIGFTVVSIAGFAPWAITGGWLYRNIGEVGMYLVCAAVFIGLAGPLMHRLIIGPGSLSRFYKLFALTFAVYSAAWIGGWMALKGHPGSIAGLFAGTALMGWMLARAFDAEGETLKVVAALFLLNSLGYFAGGVIEGALLRLETAALPRPVYVMAAKSVWGVCYGAGFGAGLGLAFYWCQAKTRALLRGDG